MAKKTLSNKIYATYTIDEDVKKRFNIACATLNINMSETVQAMMQNFLDISENVQKLESDRLSSLNNLEVEVEIVDNSTRLKEDTNG
jgi:antitoxin component of RelBE/YafQ-DinJ toxin-antitoxin module